LHDAGGLGSVTQSGAATSSSLLRAWGGAAAQCQAQAAGPSLERSSGVVAGFGSGAFRSYSD